jgi:hypothetical protein
MVVMAMRVNEGDHSRNHDDGVDGGGCRHGVHSFW